MGTLTFRPEVDDDGKELVCKAENPKYPGAVIEAKTILRVACKSFHEPIRARIKRLS